MAVYIDISYDFHLNQILEFDVFSLHSARLRFVSSTLHSVLDRVDRLDRCPGSAAPRRVTVDLPRTNHTTNQVCWSSFFTPGHAKSKKERPAGSHCNPKQPMVELAQAYTLG